MDWIKLDSKMLASVAYDAEKSILHLRFRSGDVYRYFDFPAGDYQQFLDAESRGRYFLGQIRTGSATSAWPNSRPPDLSRRPRPDAYVSLTLQWRTVAGNRVHFCNIDLNENANTGVLPFLKP